MPYNTDKNHGRFRRTDMDQIEELAEEVRKYEHLYNCNSWKEISANVGLQVNECTKLWRKIRDKFVLQ